MSKNALSLPTPHQAYQSLCTHGEQFSDADGSVSRLGNLSYHHARNGRVDVTVDNRVLPAIGRVYADGDTLFALRQRGVPNAPLHHVVRLAQRVSNQDRMWGFSGFATHGYGYSTEACGMSKLYEHLARINRKPALAIDGASRAGVLGLSGVIAKRHAVPTLGFTPLQGLASIAPRDHMVVKGSLYVDREALVGTLPDILVCVGGGDGARRECQAALKQGGVVLMLVTKPHASSTFPGSYQKFEDIRKAESRGQLIVCNSRKNIAVRVDEALEASAHFSISRRADRLRAVGQLLAA